ncbi:MAG: hypothetical protein J5598_00330, partial [Clostridia bacterium]|nr:hypothetical protein [Clostridia bacterium]
MTNGIVLIVILLIILVVVMVFFAFLDKVLKGSTTKAPEKKPVTSMPAKPAEKPNTEKKELPAMKIYNSELADDLDKMIKDSDDRQQTSRLQFENHINKENNITKYIQDKNY